MTTAPTPFLEDLTTRSGAPMFAAETRAYLRACRLARRYAPAVLAPYRTDTCAECADIITGDGFVPTASAAFAHVVQDGAVILGCEGYWMVSPAAVGLPLGHWEDWREDWTVAGIALLTAAGVALDPGAVTAAVLCITDDIDPPLRAITFPAPEASRDVSGPLGPPLVMPEWVTYDVPLASWSADLTRDQAIVLDANRDGPGAADPRVVGELAPHGVIGHEALCRKCGEIFMPDLTYPDGSGLEHYQRSDQRTECGGRGDLVGSWK